MRPEPALRWRRVIGSRSTLPVAWLLEVGPSAAYPAVRLALATDAIRAAVGRENIEVRRSRSGALATSDPALCVSTASGRGCLAIALARGPVGVDVEAITPLDPIPLAVLHPDERDYVRDAPIGRFFALWTAKEADIRTHHHRGAQPRPLLRMENWARDDNSAMVIRREERPRDKGRERGHARLAFI